MSAEEDRNLGPEKLDVLLERHAPKRPEPDEEDSDA